MHSQRAETILLLVKHIGQRQNRISPKSTMALNIPSHAVNKMNHRHTGVGNISVAVDNTLHVHGTVNHQRVCALVPMDVTGDVGVHPGVDEHGLEGVAHTGLVG